VTAADDVVVGAGIYGAAVAWELARRRRDVVVLEAGAVACGASGGPGQRGVRANGRHPQELPLARLAAERWPTLATALGGATGFVRTGHLQLIERTTDLPAARETVVRQRRHGVPSELLAADEVRSLEPGVSSRVVAAVYCPLDGTADHVATTRSYAGAARHHGARVLEGMAVAEVEVEGDRAVGVVTSDGSRVGVRRSLLLLCNTGVAELLGGLGQRLPVFTVHPQVLVTAAVDPVPVRHLIGHGSRPLALKALPGGEVMITGGRLGRPGADGRPRVEPREVEANRADAAAVFPALADVPLALATADRAESATVDLLPVIDRVPGTANALFATGWTGHGWAIAPAVAELLAGWAPGGRRPALLAPFALDRFERREPGG
jgi:sarcosine oxidase, subunit beta